MEHHDIGCTQFSLGSTMETRGYTVRDLIIAVRCKQTQACDYGLHLETHVSSSIYSYHDAVQRPANFSQPPSPHTCVVTNLKVGMFLRHKRLCAKKLKNYWRLVVLFLIFPIKKTFYPGLF